MGLVYLFIAEGYQTILGADRPWEGLDKERILRNLLEATIEKQDTRKIQIVGVQELTPIMARFSRAAEGELGPLLLGHGRQMSYDSPKIAEAIIRLARPMHCGEEPIFRFDADVELDDENLTQLLRFYEQERGRGNKFYFFSGGYRCRRADQIIRFCTLSTWAVC